MAAFFTVCHGVMVAVVLALGLAMAAQAAQDADVATEPGHHVVGGDRGWDVASNIAEWSLGKVFKVGDSIWFAYSTGEESIVELGSKEEFDACDLSNPIGMYTDGLNEVPLEDEGPRYFASGRPESCRGGLKLHVAVQQPYLQEEDEAEEEAAQAPVAPPVPGGETAVREADGPSVSGSHRLGVSLLVCAGTAFLRHLLVA